MLSDSTAVDAVPFYTDPAAPVSHGEERSACRQHGQAGQSHNGSQVAEGLSLIQRNGMDFTQFLDVIAGGGNQRGGRIQEGEAPKR